MAIYPVIGLMSGTSLDGLDVCHALFEEKDGHWNYHLEATHCYEYDEDFRNNLRRLPDGTALEMAAMHARLGKVTGEYLLDFLAIFPGSRDCMLIVSHGQTIFHQPERRFTTQIGCGATIAALTGKAVVTDLRSMDVALGGQGAPLVPLGERHLFPGYRQFLNIGGICNIAIHRQDGISAFDVCPGNTLLNHFATKAGFAYDEGGRLAASGQLIESLLQSLDDLPFLSQSPPKSLGTEHILSQWIPLIEQKSHPIPDILCTCVEHIARQIAQVASSEDMLVTGGGAFNTFLIQRLRHHLPHLRIEVPNSETVQYKEALIMGYLGLLRYLGRPNTLPQVTGASVPTIGGAVYLPPPIGRL